MTTNGSDPGSPQQQQPVSVSKDVVDLLERMLIEARTGQIVAFGAVVVRGPGFFSLSGAGEAPLEISCGARELDEYVRARMKATSQQKQQQYQVSRIMRAPSGWEPPRGG